MESSEVVWEAVNSDAPQIPGFFLALGDNPNLPKNLADFGFVADIPARGLGFQLTTGIEYKIEVWSKDEKNVEVESFVFPIGISDRSDDSDDS